MDNEIKINEDIGESSDFDTNSDDISKDQRRVVNIRCQNVYKIFRQANLEVIALKDVNLDIYAGEIVVIMGPSGSGKTTLLNVISGMDRTSAGHIFIRGYDITRMNDQGVQKILQNEIGIVFQFFNLIPSLTAEGNIELPMIIAGKDIKFRKERVKKLIDEIDLKDRAHHRPFTLSGGEKQKIAIAMAFANNPTVILADEPSGNIDSVSSENIMKIFQEFIKKNPTKSVVIVTHNPNLRKIADRTLIIKDGQIIRELGRLQTEKPDFVSEDDEGIQELNKIVQYNKRKDQVENILDPRMRFQEFKDLKNCPNCKSINIIKKFDQEQGNFKLKNGQLITRASVFCQDCFQLSYVSVSLFDVQKELK
ncbi:MAG: ABC transporter ATP-binding protein [Promethearchaeota archaeon]